MTLVDTSAWVEYLRATGSPTNREVRELLSTGAPVHSTEVIVMEVLAGARDDDHLRRLRRLMARCDHLALGGLATFESAAHLFRTCRRAGETVRALTDCLIGAVALRAGVPVLHDDRDFDVLARHAGVPARRSS